MNGLRRGKIEVSLNDKSVGNLRQVGAMSRV